MAPAAPWAQSQLEALNALLREIIPNNPFYRRKLEAAGAPAAYESLDAFFASAPFTTKGELAADQRDHPPYGTNLTYPLARYTRYHQTSGSTGSPLRWLDTPRSWAWMKASWRDIYRAAGVAPGDRLMFAFSFGPFLGFWTAFDAAADMGCLCIPGGGLSSDGRMRLIRDNRVGVLCCTPTYALRLGEAAGAETAGVRAIIVAGEPGGGVAETRDRISALWGGAAVVDHHGMTEVGPVSYAEPGEPDCLRIIERAYLAEIIDPETGALAAPGETGELVLTTLGRLGSPLLRYRTGDLVRRGRDGGPLSCYRLAGGILGRIDDMVLIRGVNVYPGAVEAIIRKHPEVAEYRVRVGAERSMAEMALEIEPAPDCAAPAALAERIQEALRAAFSLRVPVKAVPPNSLPRFEMKAKRWLRD